MQIELTKQRRLTIIGGIFAVVFTYSGLKFGVLQSYQNANITTVWWVQTRFQLCEIPGPFMSSKRRSWEMTFPSVVYSDGIEYFGEHSRLCVCPVRGWNAAERAIGETTSCSLQLVWIIPTSPLHDSRPHLRLTEAERVECWSKRERMRFWARFWQTVLVDYRSLSTAGLHLLIYLASYLPLLDRLASSGGE